MPSPFPGMNPYLERPEVWKDFHSRFIPVAAEVLGAQVLPRYFVKIEEHLYVHEPGEDDRLLFGRADLSVHPNPDADPGGGVGTAVAAPAAVGIPAELYEERIPYLELTDAESGRVVTVLELLSPSNKQSKSDRQQYRAKVRSVLESDANFVEIDLLRGGPRMPWEDMPACDYCVVVSTPEDRRRDPPVAGVWPVRLRDRLPTIPVPLRAGEPPPTLDLQAILHRIYDAAGYRLYIYRGDPQPPLAPADAVWAAQILNPPGPG